MRIVAPAVAAPLPSEGLLPHHWDQAIEGALSGAVPVAVHLQPIVDLTRGTVAGYESLARFGGAFRAGPDQWFREAVRRGRGVALEHRVLGLALSALDALPPNAFLTVNVSPDYLASPAWQELVDPHPRLDRLVIEVTEHSAIADYDQVRAVMAGVRRRGATLAIDDVGAGYASLQHVMRLRPDFVKLDSGFISGCHDDPARTAMIEAFGSLAARLDAWVVAEGVETSDELACLMRLGVPLAQGWLLGRPQPGWTDVAAEARVEIAAFRRRAVDLAAVGSLVGQWPCVANDSTRTVAIRLTLVLDRDGRPTRWIGPGSGDTDDLDRPLITKAETPIKALALRAMTRPDAVRFVPAVCTDDTGRYLGVVRIEDLVNRLAAD